MSKASGSRASRRQFLEESMLAAAAAAMAGLSPFPLRAQETSKSANDAIRHAVIGLSRPRRNHTFEGLALDERLRARDAVARCGLQIVDIDTGHAVEWLRFEHTIDELYDVAVMPGVRQAEAVGFRADDIEREIIPG